MSAPTREATDDYSKETRPRIAAGLALAGVALTVVAAFTPVIEITVLTVPQEEYTGLDRSGPGLLLLAGLALLMLAGAWRGARPAMAAVAVVGLGVLAVVLLVDAPDVNDAGAWPQADLYEEATAQAGIGFWFESAGGVLLLLAGGLMLLLAPRRGPARDRPLQAPVPAATREGRMAERAARRQTVGGETGTTAGERDPGPAAPPPSPAPPPPARRRQGGLVGKLRGRK